MKRILFLIIGLVLAFGIKSQDLESFNLGDTISATKFNVLIDSINLALDNDSIIMTIIDTLPGDVELSNALSGKLEAGDVVTDLDGTPYRVLYINSTGDVTELALGADGTYLKSNGASSNPTFDTPSSSGDVVTVGTPVNTQMGVWTGDGTLGAGAYVVTTSDSLIIFVNSSGDTLQAYTEIARRENIGDIAPLLTDTIALYSFGLGSGLVQDTAAFVDNAIIGTFYNAGSDTLHITSMMAVLAEGVGTETVGVQISWHATFKSVSATSLNAAAYTVTSITTGNQDTSFANAVIPPGVFVWGIISATSTGNKPSLLSVTLSGYKTSTY